jgi:hypothetical protein
MSGIPVNRSNQPIQNLPNPPHLNSDAGGLPSDIFQKMLSFCNPFEHELNTAVNKYWRSKTIDTVRCEEITKLKELATVCSNDLTAEKQSRLKPIIEELNRIYDFPNLVELKNYFTLVIEGLADVLQELPDESLEVLKELAERKNLNNFEYFCFLLSWVKEVRSANHIQDERGKSEALKTICNKFLAFGMIDHAITLANLIPLEFERIYTLRDLLDKVLELEEIDSAIAIVDKLDGYSIQSQALLAICNKLLELKKISRAVEIANRISDGFHRSQAMGSIRDNLVELQTLEEALAIANTISNPVERSSAIKAINKCRRQIDV